MPNIGFSNPALRGATALRGVLALVAGALLPLAMAPLDWWPLALASVVLLFWLLKEERDRSCAFWLGLWFGIGQYAVGASWVYVSIRVYGSASVPLAVFLVAAFVLAAAVFMGFMAWLFVRLDARSRLAKALCFAACWVVVEWLLTWVLTGFPWLFAGYALMQTPLVGYAPVGGVLLVSFAGILTAALAVMMIERGGTGKTLIGMPLRIWSCMLGIALTWLIGALLTGVAWTQPGAQKTVALVQGNIPQDIKWTRAHADAIGKKYESLTQDHWDKDLVIWPEAAITTWWKDPQSYLADLDGRGSGDLVTGLFLREQDGESVLVYNGAASTTGGRYHKRRLVPFGDYVPLESLLRGLIAFFDLPMSNARPGASDQPLMRVAGMHLALAICYEIAYPELVRKDAALADVLVTISNDTWFGDSIGPHQHLHIARMRAIETGRYLLRATNDGITAIIDARGGVASTLPRFEAGVLTGSMTTMHGKTPYMRFGLLWLVLTLLACVYIVAFERVGDSRR